MAAKGRPVELTDLDGSRSAYAAFVQRLGQAADTVRIRGMVVHALSAEARAFSCVWGWRNLRSIP